MAACVAGGNLPGGEKGTWVPIPRLAVGQIDFYFLMGADAVLDRAGGPFWCGDLG